MIDRYAISEYCYYPYLGLLLSVSCLCLMLVLHVLPCLGGEAFKWCLDTAKMHSVPDLRTQLESPGLVMDGGLLNLGITGVWLI